MKSLFSFLFIALTFSGYAQDIINDKNAETRAVGSFSAIKVSGAIEVYLSQSNSEALAVSASEDKFRARIKT